MNFAANQSLRDEMLAACRLLTHFRIVEGFGHVSARIAGSERLLITPRRALGLVTDAELVEIDPEGRPLGDNRNPPLELSMHLAVYRRRTDVKAIVRGHPRNVAAYACAGEPLRVAHGFGANLGSVVPVVGEPYLVTNLWVKPSPRPLPAARPSFCARTACWRSDNPSRMRVCRLCFSKRLPKCSCSRRLQA